MPLPYYVWLIYDDGSEHFGEINAVNDIARIPKNKPFEACRIFYADKIHSHVLYGRDNIYINADPTNQHVIYSQWSDGDTTSYLITMAGVGQETRQENVLISSFPNNRKLQGRLLPDNDYEAMRVRCHQVNVDEELNK